MGSTALGSLAGGLAGGLGTKFGKDKLFSSQEQQNISALSPEQNQFLSSILGLGQGNLQNLVGSIGQPTEDIFQKSFVQPALQSLQQQILPAIQQRFVDANAGASSALNQALAQAAGNVSTQLGSQYGQFQQNQQGLNLDLLKLLGSLATNQNFTPLINQKPGLLGPLLGTAGAIGGGYFGGPQGASLGYNLGSGIGGAF